MLSVRIVLILIVTISSCQGNPPNVKVIPSEMVDDVIASAERPTGGSFAYSRPYPYLPYGQFGSPYGQYGSPYGQFGFPYGQFGRPYGYMRPFPGFGQTTGEGPEETIEEPEGENDEPSEESIKKRATEDDAPIIIEIIGGEPFYEEEPIIPVDEGEEEPEEEVISEDPDWETAINEGPTGEEVESEINYP